MERTDIHRPSAIKPEDYQWVAFQYYGSADLGAILAMKAERERLNAHMATTGGTYSSHGHGGVCHICGNGLVTYASVFYHKPSNAYIVTGEDCAMKMDMAVGGDWNVFRKRITNFLEAQAGKKKAQAYLETKSLSRCWELYTVADTTGFKYEELTIRDIVSKLVKYGSISPKAEAYLVTLLGKLDTRDQREAEHNAARKLEAETAEPVPVSAERIQVAGTVLAVKVQESNYGSQVKMLVKENRGFKLWGTAVGNAQVGDAINFWAAIEPSKDDPKFGFFKRPTKVEVVSSRNAE